MSVSPFAKAVAGSNARSLLHEVERPKARDAHNTSGSGRKKFPVLIYGFALAT
jgi:hypothetical protein